MILIKITDEMHARKALGYLAGRFSFKTWANGDIIVPEDALAHELSRFESVLVI
ncbi:MAG: hypothetical protein HY040_14885 [Planctomycetes bacterium]|nr:hypothetical protein [Planctomycetota bacterium]